MTFQAYIDNIKAKTGLTPEQFKSSMEKAGVLKFDMKAKIFTEWLAAEYSLGHGHAMALWGYFGSKGWVSGPKRNVTKP
jgi:Domain of unknown function (DUF4287)